MLGEVRSVFKDDTWRLTDALVLTSVSAQRRSGGVGTVVWVHICTTESCVMCHRCGVWACACVVL